MAAPKRKQDKATTTYPAATKRPKYGKEADKPKKSTSASKKDVGVKKSKKPAKPAPKPTTLSVESDSDELGDDEAFGGIKDDGSGAENEVEEDDEMSVDGKPEKSTGDGQTGCRWQKVQLGYYHPSQN